MGGGVVGVVVGEARRGDLVLLSSEDGGEEGSGFHLVVDDMTSSSLVMQASGMMDCSQ